MACSAHPTAVEVAAQDGDSTGVVGERVAHLHGLNGFIPPRSGIEVVRDPRGQSRIQRSGVCQKEDRAHET